MIKVSNGKSQWQNLLKKWGFLPFAIVFFAYTIYRALHLSIVCDEGGTYIFSVKRSWWEIITYAMRSANNHLLNSLSIKFVLHFLPLSQGAIRLPVLICHLIYLIFTWLILKDIKNAWLKIIFYILLNIQPFLLDFFSLARGYGMSIGLMIASIYYLKEYLFTKETYSNLTLALVFGALASLASFSVANYYIALCTVIFIAAMFRLRNARSGRRERLIHFCKTMIPVFIISVPLMLYILHIVSFLQSIGQLWFGGKAGFYSDTIASLSYCFYYVHEWPWNDAARHHIIELSFMICVTVVFVCALSLAFYSYLAKKDAAQGFGFLRTMVFILFISSFSTVLENGLMGTFFLSGRFAIFYIPLFLFVFVYLLYCIQLLRPRTWSRSMAFILCGALILYYACKLNFSSFLIWNENEKTMLEDLVKYRQGAKEKKNVTIYAAPIMWCTMTTYQEINKDNWYKLSVKDAPDLTEDYFMLEKLSYDTLKTKVMEIKEYEISDKVLAKNLKTNEK